MGLKIKRIKLPFVTVAGGTNGVTRTWHLGPVSRNSRTGRTTVKLGRNLSWQSKSRSEKAKKRKAKTAKRAAEKKAWDAKLNGDSAKAPADPAISASTKPGVTYRGASGKTTTGKGARPRATASPAPNAATATQTGTPAGGPVPLGVTFAERQQSLRASGLCGAKTSQNHPCLNPKNSCPHH